jgi:hypothetical protein
MSTDPSHNTRSAEQVLAEEFLLARSRILDLAALLDRLERAPGSTDHVAQMQLLGNGLKILCDDESEKARRVQLLMSREYDPAWRTNYGLH